MTTIALNEILAEAEQLEYAVGAFNLNTDLQAQAIFAAAFDQQSPLIVQASKGACLFQGQPKDDKNPTTVELARGARRIRDIADAISKAYPGLDYVMHLDHGENMEIITACIEAGFSSVMIDGSHLTLEDNILLTRQVVEYARERGRINGAYISVEGELGTLGGKSHSGGTSEIIYTKPEDVVTFVQETGVDALAIAWGTKHGKEKPKSGLKPEVIKKCYDELRKTGLNCYLVSHGSSTVPVRYVNMINSHGGSISSAGVPAEEIRRAIEYGARKINIDTDLRLAMTAAIREVLDTNKATIDPREYLVPARKAMYEAATNCMQLFGSDNRISR